MVAKVSGETYFRGKNVASRVNSFVVDSFPVQELFGVKGLWSKRLLVSTICGAKGF